ncbi:ester cyclase [Rhodococcoides kyotonense]|uniref:Ester cyclase n=1 Tax=Rhodococcoides kyotonense TaxID=398843 RepID=A0A239LGD8_9NOCA|nr:ester cyclase [Rhodococcus kyotonensis]SNT29541.1 conserved hypothetical protein, steroid delta-isomerase-related [Rhodococcus kyotonensis]
MTTRRSQLEQAWNAAWDNGDVDALDAVLAPGYVRYGSNGHTTDRATFKASIVSTRAAFPDLTTVVDDILIDGDRAAIRWHSTGTHTGPFLGIPTTGRTVEVSGATFAVFDGDTITEEHVTWDPRALLSALNIITVGQD